MTETTPLKAAAQAFTQECCARVQAYGQDRTFQESSLAWTRESWARKYSYNFCWMGRPIIQLPQDMIAMQELIWEVKPDLIIETGIAHGGSLVFYASLLQLIAQGGRVLGIDVEIRTHNRTAIEAHPMAPWIEMLEGNSVAPATLAHVKQRVAQAQIQKPRERNARVMVCLDSDHSHAHCTQELEAYAPLVTAGSYLVVFDTIAAHLAGMPGAKPDFATNNPLHAVQQFLAKHPEFEAASELEHKLMITHNPQGYLRRKT